MVVDTLTNILGSFTGSIPTFLKGNWLQTSIVLIAFLILAVLVIYLGYQYFFKKKLNVRAELEIFKDTSNGVVVKSTLLKSYKDTDGVIKWIRSDNELEVQAPPRESQFFRLGGKRKRKFYAYEDSENNLHYCKFHSHYKHPKTGELTPFFIPLKSNIKRWFFQTIRSKFERYRFIDELTKWQPAIIMGTSIIAAALFIIVVYIT